MKNNFSGALELINQVCTNTNGQFAVLCDELPVPSIQIQIQSNRSTQWPSWGQRKVAIVERGPLWGGREVIWRIFCREYKYSRPVYNLYVSYQHSSIQMEARLVVVLIESLVSFICITTWFTVKK